MHNNILVCKMGLQGDGLAVISPFFTTTTAMNILDTYQKAGVIVMRIFRWNFQPHFFWGFVLTLQGIWWPPLFAAGIAATMIKEALDLRSKKHWCWIDFGCGIVGSIAALIFLCFEPLAKLTSTPIG